MTAQPPHTTPGPAPMDEKADWEKRVKAIGAEVADMEAATREAVYERVAGLVETFLALILQ